MLWVPQHLFLRTGPRDSPRSCSGLSLAKFLTRSTIPHVRHQQRVINPQPLNAYAGEQYPTPHRKDPQWNRECLKESGPKTRAFRDRKNRFAARSKLV